MRAGSHLTGFRCGCNEGSRLLSERVYGRSREMDTPLPLLSLVSLSLSHTLSFSLSLLCKRERERVRETADPPIPERRLWSASPLLVRFVFIEMQRASESLTLAQPRILPFPFFFCPLLLFFFIFSPPNLYVLSFLSPPSFLSLSLSPPPPLSLSFRAPNRSQSGTISISSISSRGSGLGPRSEGT